MKRTLNSQRFFTLIILGSAILIVLALLGELALTAAGGLLIVADPIKHSDALVVLSGADQLRLGEAVRLYKENYAERIILTETDETYPGLDASYSQVRRQELASQGIPLEAILVTKKSAQSTVDEARVVRDLMQANEWKSCIVITDPYHTFRTRLIFRRELSGTGLRVRVHPVSNHWYRSPTWWTTAQGREVTLLEYTKIFSYLIGVRGD